MGSMRSVGFGSISDSASDSWELFMCYRKMSFLIWTSRVCWLGWKSDEGFR